MRNEIKSFHLFLFIAKTRFIFCWVYSLSIFISFISRKFLWYLSKIVIVILFLHVTSLENRHCYFWKKTAWIKTYYLYCHFLKCNDMCTYSAWLFNLNHLVFDVWRPSQIIWAVSFWSRFDDNHQLQLNSWCYHNYGNHNQKWAYDVQLALNYRIKIYNCYINFDLFWISFAHLAIE